MPKLRSGEIDLLHQTANVYRSFIGVDMSKVISELKKEPRG